jgi:hypothetical protein
MPLPALLTWARYPNDTGGSESSTATQFDLCESDRIIRGLEWALWNALLPKLRPPNRRALFSMATDRRHNFIRSLEGSRLDWDT